MLFIKTLYTLIVFLSAFFILAFAPQGFPDEGKLEESIGHLGSSSRQEIIAAVEALRQLGDHRALPALEALLDRRLRVTKAGRILIKVKNGHGMMDAVTGAVLAQQLDGLDTPVINNQVRIILGQTIAILKLVSPEAELRLAAAEELLQHPQEEATSALRAAIDREKTTRVRRALALALALTEVACSNKERRIAALNIIGQSDNPNFIVNLRPLLARQASGEFQEPDEQVRQAARSALSAIERHMVVVGVLQNLFYGLSLGSVLLLVALGLAITFGLMEVINMAHGEMLMLGAYSTYVIQGIFKAHCPDQFAWYLVASIPTAFIVSGVVGMILERSIIRYLYGRPLETLLATWGISLLLIQTVRLIFGAQNVEVSNPPWLSGGWELMPGLMLTYNRIAIIGFGLGVVLLVWVFLNRSPLGLQVRAVTQNRAMAAALGIYTSRVDTWTFGLGSGIAGLAGVALSQIGNVGPELGQSYIVDSFMVVVLGGVGKLAGTIWGATGLGVINKFLEPFTGAVLGKIMVLVFIILFIQKRPQGIFALKGRMAEG
ncbi:MAG: urea ABC transporter permease subunit UrtB [Deltaproteobacteria bacterium]|nr:urea ABC transporter permease subunit UrtB [Deltaproteobacteria bacterium]